MELIDKGRVDKLTERVKACQSQMARKLQEGLAAVRDLGEALAELKDQLPRDLFDDHCEQHFQYSARSARDFIRIAQNWDQVRSADSISSALAMLKVAREFGRALPNLTKNGKTPSEKEEKEATRPLDNEAVSGAIAQMQVSVETPEEAAEHLVDDLVALWDELPRGGRVAFLRAKDGEIRRLLPEIHEGIPDELDNAEFRVAWDSWVQYRKERKKKLTESTAAKQIKKLARMGTGRAIVALNHSIEQGYTGIFEPGSNGARTNTDVTRETLKGYLEE